MTTPSNEARLLPCPFCGSEAEYWLNPSDDGCGEPNHQCHCTRCEASITFSASEDDAIKNWNTRVTYKRDEPKGLKSADEWFNEPVRLHNGQYDWLGKIKEIQENALASKDAEIAKLRGVVGKLSGTLMRSGVKLHTYAVNHSKASHYGKDSDKEYWKTIQPMIQESLRSADEVLG